jgi:hypothetical protein
MQIRIAALSVGLVGAIAVTPVRARAQPLARAGGLGDGISVDPVELGASEAFARGGSAVGVRAAIGVQLDLDARWAVRMPIVLGGAFSGDRASYSELDIVPGVVYRFRSDADQRWVPYLGGGIKLGAWGAHRALIDKPLAAPPVVTLRDWDDDHDWHGDGDDPDFPTRMGVGAELWAGAEWRPRRWFALSPELTYAVVRVEGVAVHAVSESMTVRFTL